MSRKIGLAVLLSLAPLVACAESPFDGFYGGVSVGATNFDTQTADYWCFASCDAPGTSRTGATISGNVGYNWSLGRNFILGVEADLSSGVEGSETLIDQYGSQSWTYRWEDRLKALGSIRGRAGLAVDRTLAFLTAGLAGGRVDHEAHWEESASADFYQHYSANDRSTEAALIAGIGIEHFLTDRMSLKAEYLTTRLRDSRACWTDSSQPDCSDSGSSNVHWRSTIDTLRIGLNWKF